jgi:two-component system, response regulator, stage 0 sporulation protein F
MENKIKVLYIDDEEINLELFAYNFSDKYEVITDCCGLKGLDCLQKFPDIRVVISDMKMPNMNGLEFVTRAKEIFSDKMYFILTGYDITEEIRAAIDKKIIIKYFRKPFNIKEIEDAIYNVI